MTVSELFVRPNRPNVLRDGDPKGAGTGARDARAILTATPSDDKVIVDMAPTVAAGRLVRMKTTAVTDFTTSWLWDAHGVTVRSLWEQRLPSIDRVPQANRALWIGWVAYNHLVLAVLVPLLLVSWVLSHPARLLYAAPVAALLVGIWINS